MADGTSTTDTTTDKSTTDESSFNISILFGFIFIFLQLMAIVIYYVYFMATYAHPEDTKFGRSIWSRAVPFFGFILSYIPILSVQADVALGLIDVSTEAYWNVLLVFQASYLWILSPICLVYYESNESDPIQKRIIKAFKTQIPFFLFLLLLTVPTYFFANGFTLSENQATQAGFTCNSVTKNGEPIYVGNMNFGLHMYTVTVQLGIALGSVFGGVGGIAIPADFLFDYINRPKPINSDEFNRRKKILLNIVLKLRVMGKQLEEDRGMVIETKGLTGFMKKYYFNKQMRIWETRTLACEQQYRQLQDQADYNNKVEPLVYVGKLFLFILYTVLILWFLYILIGAALLIWDPSLNSDYIIQIDQEILQLQSNNFDLEIFVSAMFFFWVVFLVQISVKGNDVYGYRFQCITFYAMTPNETQYNSLMFNALFRNAVVLGAMQKSCQLFQYYIQGTSISTLTFIVDGSQMNLQIAGLNIFTYLFFLTTFTTLAGFLIKGSGRLNYDKAEQEQKAKGTGKGAQLLDGDDDDSDENNGDLF